MSCWTPCTQAARELGRDRRWTLNVFGDNPTAIRLYESSGYTVTAQQMRRELSSPAADRIRPPPRDGPARR